MPGGHGAAVAPETQTHTVAALQKEIATLKAVQKAAEADNIRRTAIVSGRSLDTLAC